MSDERGEWLAPSTAYRDLGRGHRAGADNGSCRSQPTQMMETTAAAKDVDLSICILTRSQPQLLPECVAACLKEARRAEVTFEIIIVDNASEDRYPEKLLALSPSIRVLRNERNVGFSAGNNQAIRASRGQYVLILNDDAILQEDSLGLMLQELKSDPRIGGVGPRLLNTDGTLQRNFTHLRFPHLRGIICQLLRIEALLDRCTLTRDLFTLSRNLNRTSEADHLASACFLVYRRAIEAVNLYDESFHYLYEDADLCFRLKKAGWRIVYVAEARVSHYKSSSWMELSWLERNTIAFQSMLRFFRKHSHPVRVFLVRLALAVVMLVRLPTVILLRTWKARSIHEGLRSSVSPTLKVIYMLIAYTGTKV